MYFRLKKLILDYPVEELEHYPIDKRVNNPRYNYVDCVNPV